MLKSRTLGSRYPTAPDPSLYGGGLKSHQSRKLTSREYKLLLDARRFCGYDTALVDWWQLITTTSCNLDLSFATGNPPARESRTWYLDTVNLCLKRNGWVLRICDHGSGDGSFSVKLTTAHRDRYLAAMGGVSARGESTDEFVEEIFPGGSTYVYSSTVFRRRTPRLGTVDEFIRLFPACEPFVDLYRDEPLVKVDDTEVMRLEAPLGQAIPAGLGVPFNFLLTASYFGSWRGGRRLQGELEQHAPDVVEFSFGCPGASNGTGMEWFPAENVLIGWRLLESLAARRDWMDRDARSETDIVYERFAV